MLPPAFSKIGLRALSTVVELTRCVREYVMARDFRLVYTCQLVDRRNVVNTAGIYITIE